VVEIWQGFRRAHQRALDLAERNGGFKSFLDTVKPDQLVRLDEVLALIWASGGEAGVLERLADGRLNEAVRFLPEPAMTIARDTRSVDDALAWSALAGDLLPKLLEHEIYRHAAPQGFTRATLSKLLALDDHVAILRLASLEPAARDRLFGLPAEDLKRLSRSVSEAELAALSRYLEGLEPAPRARVLAAAAAAPAKMQSLASPRVRDAILGSTDQARAVDMMLRDGSGGPEAMIEDARAALEGRISPVLIWEKHPLVVVALVMTVLILLLMLRRLFRPRRPAGPAQTTA